MDTYCDACGAKKEDGHHPNTTCSEKEWAAHQGRMLREIINLLKPAKPAEAKSKGV